jgi:mxaJ protein
MMGSLSRFGRALGASAALVLLPALHAGAAQSQPLRVCADPNYMPYSDSAGQGFENKIAQAIGQDLGRPVEYYWQPLRGAGGFGQYVQETLGAGKCDLIVDVPYGMLDVDTTKPYYISSYVFIYKKSKGYDLTSFDSPVLRRVKIGYEADTPAEYGLKLRGLTPGQKPFMTADEPNQEPSAIVNAVENGSIDVGISWDPAVAYYAARHPDLVVKIVPNSRSQGSPEQYTFPMAMATRSNDKQLHAAIDRVIATHGAQFAAILRDYRIKFFRPGG